MENIERDMETLRRGYSAWTRDIQDIDLGNILKHARELEWNLNMTLSDCDMACRQYWKEYNFPVAEGLRRSSVLMDCIRHGLEEVKNGFHEGERHFFLFKELHDDWKEFKKCIYLTHRLVSRPHERRKNFHWLTEDDRRGNQE